MSKRHRDALAIQAGACNPLAITNSLLTALRECPDTNAMRTDPAVRLIAHQLAFLLDVRALDAPQAFVAAIDTCEVNREQRDQQQR